jgi:hypothetical protein
MSAQNLGYDCRGGRRWGTQTRHDFPMPASKAHPAAAASMLAVDSPGQSVRRVNRGSAVLLGLAVISASATVSFGVWMASYAQHISH